MKELKEQLEKLKTRLNLIEKKLDINKLTTNLRVLESHTMKSNFWTDVKNAQSVMQKISDQRGEIDQFEKIQNQIQTLEELFSLPSEDVENLNLVEEIGDLEKQINDIEQRLFLSGEFDQGGCFLTVHSGQGGVEAMDWAAMVLRMYQRYCERKNWKIFLIDETKGEEAGIKSATIEIQGRFAYGLLKKESGTHRLVRQSPFNADNLRQTSFALVEVLPTTDNVVDIQINESELEFDMFRSSGPGGQNVQKVSTAVRVKHLPSGITVSAQSERSQHQNKENALKILKAKLLKVEEEKHKESESELKNWQKTASWGTQIRSYVLHPYKLVKDLRTSFETSNADNILNGELDEFIDAEIRL